MRRVEIPKPDGGVRKLGIPTVLDRFIQQAVLQVLQRQVGSDVLPTQLRVSAGTVGASRRGPGAATYRRGLRLGGRSRSGEILRSSQPRQTDGPDCATGRRPAAAETLRAFLNAGVMENGLVGPSVEGTPQGGPLSPLLSNLVLDELDRELECRGHRFVRYADDSNIYVRSERAGHRVMDSLTRFITTRSSSKSMRRRVRWRDRRSESFSDSASPLVGGQAHDCAEGPGTVQGQGPRNHATGQRRQHRDDDSGTGSVYAGLARLFRLLRNAGGAGVPDPLGPVATPSSALAAMANTTTSAGRSVGTGGPSATGQSTRRQRTRPWYLARAKALSVGLSNAYFNSLGLPTLIDGA